tara:strand:- start:311283 stop:312017 length:735 start_codon:yes stop_codon:yes gene_type:complete
MKYYDMHEDVYKQLAAKDKISWDGQTDPKELFNHEINQAIGEKLPEFFNSYEGLCAVDLGTGTGTCALNLAKLGFKVRGFDLSETAIGLAKENAKALGVEASFEVSDITKIVTTDKVDLVVDSSLLHCLVYKEDRNNFFRVAHDLLKDEGLLFLHTMIEAKDMSEMLDRDYLVYEDHILYSTGPDRWEMDWQEVQGKRVFPHRWITTIDLLTEEVRRAGFKIVHSKLEPQERSTGTLCAWLKKI